ncbi:hypothetical protein [Aurantibacillus circumpalustris]|uniref:hypothetical protein n=1 Tax=Aurantibacillus circumpalustris TaxID=3036359 RepID=UPI00295B34B5|nr:hypothetical protein [Aurantibacillus circumpalustris]
MIRTLSQNKILHYQLGKLNIPSDVKEDLVMQFTNGRETRSSAMKPEECQALINHLNVVIKQMVKVVEVPKPVWENSPENRMRKKVLSICHEMGWKLPSGKIDMNRVNDFCEKRGHKHCKLNFYKVDELPELVTQFEKVLKAYYAKR